MTESPIVHTTHGRVRGQVEDGIAVFRGVPYAAPPTGARRYRPPEPPAAWDGVRDATAFGVTAPQTGAEGGLFTPDLPWGEDCLTLNVWTPAADGGARPVIVWVHGGAFLFGTGANPLIARGTFARDGVVFVSMNYRLGSDGFLAVSGDPDSGNYGLLDLLATLRWVRDNIATFGGDPARVTLGGQSAGATAVGALLGAPAARGLFARAIMQSGYPEPLLSPASAELVAGELHRRVGLSHGDLDGLRRLRERDPQRVLRAQMALFGEVLSTRDAGRFGAEIAVPGNPFQPVVGGRVLPTRPVDTDHGPVELLIGHNTEEFGLMFGLGMVQATPTTGALAGDFEAALPGRGADALRLYRSSRPDASATDLLNAMETDRVYRVPSTRLADAHAAGGHPTYFYRFSWRSAAFGAGHSVEQPFVFDTLDLPLAHRFTGAGAPRRLADDMHRAWVSFAATGDPNHAGIPPWPRYEPATRDVFEFGGENRVVRDPHAAERELWNEPAAVP